MALTRMTSLFSITFFVFCFRFSQLVIIEDNINYNNTFYISYKVDTIERTIIINAKCVGGTGWIGIGFSSNGDMPKSDAAVLIFDNNGESHFYDAHLVGRQPPVKDDVQDFELLSKKQENGITYLSFKRKLITCDPDDYELTEDTVKLIFAWNTQPADDLSQMTWHGNNVGIQNVLLFQKNEKNVLPNDIQFWDILANNYEIPSRTTTYYCTYHRLPEYARKTPHYFVGNIEIVQEGNEKLVHHILVSSCMGKDSYYSKLVGTSFDCTDFEELERAMECQPNLVTWAVGAGEFLLPPNVGMAVGSKFGYSDYFIIQYHYNNAQNLEGVRDSSGIRMYLTTKERTYRGGVTNIASVTMYTMSIPPQQPNFVVTSICSSVCTESFPPEGITVYAAFLHTHLAGRKIRIRHFRDGVEQPLVSADENYDFNYQQLRTLQNQPTILPGDTIMCECEYETMDRHNTTVSGLHTMEEMCYCTIMYYPETELSYCSDGLIAEDMEDFFENPNKLPLADVVKDYDWSKVSKKDMAYFQYLARYGDKQGLCFGLHLEPLGVFRARYPDIFKPLKKRNYCTKC